MRCTIKKAQASLEYLTTYGWAFILIIIMVSALAFFGILNPKKLLPDRCSFSTEFQCNDFAIVSTGEIKIQLKNNVGNAIVLSSIDAESESIQLGCTPSGDIISKTWPSGSVWNIILTGCRLFDAGILKGNKEKIKIKISYYNAKSSSEYTHIVEGELVGTVQ